MAESNGIDVWRSRLRSALVAAMKAGDRVAVDALRSTLGAIDNAEAVEAPAPPPLSEGPIAGARAGLGAGEAQRRPLSGDEIASIIRSEIDERRAAAGEYDATGQRSRADTLRAEAEVLQAFL
jgi:uncharacterized protein YqeY